MNTFDNILMQMKIQVIIFEVIFSNIENTSYIFEVLISKHLLMFLIVNY